MKYEIQIQGAMDRLDVALNRLYIIIKRGDQTEAMNYMDNGELKERYEELQNVIILSQTNPLGARGTAPQTGTL
jgi:hypothetical protein